MKEFERAFREGQEAARIMESGEPEYKFVKGQGWVVFKEPPFPFKTLTLRNWSLRFVQRKPKVGELYFYEYGTDALTSLHHAIKSSAWWMQFIDGCRNINDLSVNMPYNDGSIILEDGNTRRTYVTVEPEYHGR